MFLQCLSVRKDRKAVFYLLFMQRQTGNSLKTLRSAWKEVYFPKTTKIVYLWRKVEANKMLLLAPLCIWECLFSIKISKSRSIIQKFLLFSWKYILITAITPVIQRFLQPRSWHAQAIIIFYPNKLSIFIHALFV